MVEKGRLVGLLFMAANSLAPTLFLWFEKIRLSHFGRRFFFQLTGNMQKMPMRYFEKLVIFNWVRILTLQTVVTKFPKQRVVKI